MPCSRSAPTLSVTTLCLFCSLAHVHTIISHVQKRQRGAKAESVRGCVLLGLHRYEHYRRETGHGAVAGLSLSSLRRILTSDPSAGHRLARAGCLLPPTSTPGYPCSSSEAIAVRSCLNTPANPMARSSCTLSHKALTPGDLRSHQRVWARNTRTRISTFDGSNARQVWSCGSTLESEHSSSVSSVFPIDRTLSARVAYTSVAEQKGAERPNSRIVPFCILRRYRESGDVQISIARLSTCAMGADCVQHSMRSIGIG